MGERRRRAEAIERHQREEAIKEWRRQQLEEAERQRAHEERQQRAHKKRRQRTRRAYLEEKRTQQQQQRHQDSDDDDYELDIVRGRDGNLYYVKRPISTKKNQQQQQSPQHKQQPTIAEEQAYDHSEESSSSSEEGNISYGYESSEEDFGDLKSSRMLAHHRMHPIRRRGAVAAESPTRPKRSSITEKRSSTTGRRLSMSQKSLPNGLTFLVEDASDSECENEFDSPWRNRRPSPGQWMEPVEALEALHE